jgi:putative ABC transport system substrate-binding protein
MRRRDFIGLLGGATVAWPLAARAQQAAVPVIGFLNPASPDWNPRSLAAFHRGLAEAGFVEGRNVAIEYRWAYNNDDRLPELAADLVRRRVDVIVAPGSSQTVLAAKSATTTIPIVFQTGADPVALGLVDSLNHPGGNLTGVGSMNVELDGKRLGLLHELLPGAIRFALVLNPNSPASVKEAQTAQVQAACAAIGGLVEVFYASTIAELETMFASRAQRPVDAVQFATNSLLFSLRSELAAAVTRKAIPAIYWDRALVEAGGLMSYGTDSADQFRQTGIYAGRVLKGDKPADLPINRATKFELVINFKTAKALGLTVPPTLLAIADEVIE